MIVLAVLRTTTLFLALLFLPGYVTLRALGAKGLDWPETLFLSVFSSVLLSSWLGLLLAELALFSLGSLLGLLVIYSVSMAVVFKIRLTWGSPPTSWGLRRVFIRSLMVGVIVIAGLLFFRPFESVLGTTDAGVYLGMGVNIAKTGAIRARDPLLTDLSDGMGKALLYSYRFPSGSELMRFFGDGVRIWDVERGILFSQQNHLYQVWIAIFYAIFGMRVGMNPLPPLDLLGILDHFASTPMLLYVTPLFGLLGVIALYFVGEALFDDRVGLLASFLLAINVVQMWFSRWAMSELLTQFLVFGALYCFVLYVKTSQTHPLLPDRQIRRPDLEGNRGGGLPALHAIQAERGGQSAQRGFGLLAGFGLGLAVLSRADGVFLIGPVALYLVYLRLTRKLRSQRLYFFAPFAALLLHWLIHTLLFSRTQAAAIAAALPYFSSIGPVAVGGAVVVAALLVLALLLSPRRQMRRLGQLRAPIRPSSLEKWLRPTVAALIILLALYAYFIRPSTADPQMVYYHPAGGMIRTYNEENLVRLGWYVTPLGLLLALGGLVAVILKESDESVMFFLGVALLYSFVFIHSALVNPIHIYWVRRYAAVVIPSLMLFISYGLFQLSKIKFRVTTALRGTLPIILGLALTISFLQTSLALAGPEPYRAAVWQIGRLAGQLGDRSAVILESPLIGDPFALPLTYLYNKDAFVWQEQNWDSDYAEPFSELVGRWRDRGREVFYVAADGLTRVRSDDYLFSPVGEAALEIVLPETSFDHLPKGVVHQSYDLEVYRIEPAWKRAEPAYPFSLDVGRFDYGYLMSGFYGREGGPGGWYRWTGGTAEVLLPWVPSVNSETRGFVLSLTAGSPRPDGVEPAKVTLYLNERLLDTFDLGNEFKTHTVVISPDFTTAPQVKTALLRLETNPWIPAEAGLEDVRELGIVLDRIELDRLP